MGFGSSFPGCGFAVEVDGRIGVENGCEIPGVDDEKVGRGAFGCIVSGGGCGDAAFGVDGTVATEREVVDEGILREKRKRRLRRHEVQSMVVALLGHYGLLERLNLKLAKETMAGKGRLLSSALVVDVVSYMS